MRYNYNYRNERGEYAPKVLLVDGCEVHGASAAMYAAQGYYPYTPPEPTAEDTAERDRLARIDELHPCWRRATTRLSSTPRGGLPPRTMPQSRRSGKRGEMRLMSWRGD